MCKLKLEQEREMRCDRNGLGHPDSYSQYQLWSWEHEPGNKSDGSSSWSSSELLLCWFLQHQHRSCQHLHWSWCNKRRLQEVCIRCNWSEHSRAYSCSINLDYWIWTRSLDSWTRSSFQNCIIFNLYYIIISLILFYCIESYALP